MKVSQVKIKAIKKRIYEGEPVSFAERNLVNMYNKKHSKKAKA